MQQCIPLLTWSQYGFLVVIAIAAFRCYVLPSKFVVPAYQHDLPRNKRFCLCVFYVCVFLIKNYNHLYLIL